MTRASSQPTAMYRYAVSAAVPARPLGAWSRMLAATVYNPRVRVQFEYERADRYTLDDLKAAFGLALEADDDVLTQFHEPEELRGKLAAAASFAAVAAVLELSRTETDAASNPQVVRWTPYDAGHSAISSCPGGFQDSDVARAAGRAGGPLFVPHAS